MLKRTAKLLLVVFVALSVAGTAAGFWLNSSGGKTWLKETLAARLSSPDQRITIGGLSGDIFSEVRIDQLGIADGEGMWLRVERIDLSWRPLRLLSGRIFLDQIQLTGGALSRVPEGQGSAGPFELPALPYTVSLNHFEGDLGFEGEPYNIRAEGVLLDQAKLRAQLDVRGGPASDLLMISGYWAGRERPFSVDASLTARDGGLIRTLLPFAYAGETTAQLKAQGTLADWSAVLDMRVAERFELKAEGKGDDGTWRVTVQQSRNLLLDGPQRELLGGPVSATMEMTPDGSAPWPFVLELQGQGLSTQVTGKIDPSADFAVQDGQINGQLASIEAAGIEVKGFDANVVFSVRSGRLDASYGLHLNHGVADDLTVNAVKVEGTLAGSGQAWQGRVVSVTGEVAWRDVRDQIVGGAGDWAMDLDGDGWRAKLEQLTTASKNRIGGFAAGKAAVMEEATLDIGASTGFLSQWMPLEPGEGRFDVHLISTRQSDGLYAVEATANGVAIEFTDPQMAALVGSAPSLAALGKAQSDGSVAITSARLTGKGGAATASGALTPEVLNVSYDIALNEVPAQVRSVLVLDGKVGISGTIGGTYQRPTATVTAGLKELTGYGVTLKDVTFGMAFLPAGEGTENWRGHGTLLARSTMGVASTNLDVTLSRSGEVGLEAETQHPGLDGRLSAKRLLAGDVEATLTVNLVPGDYDTSAVDGQASLVARYMASKGRASADVQLRGQGVSVITEGLPLVEVGILNANIQVPLTAGETSLALDANIAGVRSGQYELEKLNVTADPAMPDKLHLEGSGRAVHPFSIALEIASAGRTVSLTGGADYGGYQIGLAEPATLEIGKIFKVQAPQIAVNEGAVSALIQVSADVMSADISLKEIDLRFVNLISPGVLQDGNASGWLKAGWRRGRAESLRASLDLTGLAFRPEGFVTLQDSTRYSARLSATTLASSLEVTGAFSDPAGAIGTIEGLLPYKFDAEARIFELRENEPLTAAVTWKGDVEPLWRLVGRGDHLLEGEIEGDLKVEGTLNDPVFSGSLGLSGGRYEYLPLGMVASIDELSIRGSGDEIKLAALRASDGETGRLTANGAFGLSSRLSFPGSLSIKLEDFQVARLDMLRGKVSADLTYTRRPDGDRLSGQVVTGKMNVYLPKEMPIEVVDLDVVEINGTFSDQHPVRRARQKEKQTSLDVAIKVPDRMFVEGRGLYSEWQGELALSGYTADPRLTGQVALKNGFLNFGSKKIDLEQGAIDFRGRRGFDPDLALRARYVARSIDATMTLSGVLSAPSLKFQSVPELPEDEIMSRILLGRSAAELSALQVAELASAANTLRGGKGADVIGSVRRKLGLDTLSIERTDDEGEGKTLVSGGKYLRDNIFLELETVPASSQAAARLQVEVGKHIALETEVGLQQRSRVRLKWFWEY